VRIVLVVPAFPRLSETFIVSKFRGLVDRGLDVHVVAMRAGNREAWDRFPGLDAPALRGRVHSMVPGPGWRDRRRLAARVARSLARGSRPMWEWAGAAPLSGAARRRLVFDSAIVALAPDVLHFEFAALAPGRVDLGRRLGARVAVSFRGYDANYVGLDHGGRYDEVWRGAQGYHFLGEDLRRRALARGCPADALHVTIPPAIDVERFDPDRIPREPGGGGVLRILSVGRLAWKKGYEFGMEAVRQLVDRGVECRWEIVGDGPHYECVAYARHQLGLAGRVELVGELPPEAVRRRLAAADVFLHPAVSEGFCNAVLEAQAMRLPVVCTDADGLRENVVDGETGWVVPRRDPGALAERLVEAARDPEGRERMGRAGRARVLERFGLEAQLARFEAFYRQLLEAPR